MNVHIEITSFKATTTVNLQAETLKGLCWLYGCAKKDSPEEKQLLAILVERIQGGAE